MAKIIELEDALERYEHVLFDTCVLIEAFKAEADGRPYPYPSLVPRPSRLASMVSITEFLRGPTLSREERRGRDAWLDDHGVRRRDFDVDVSRTLRSQLRATTLPWQLGDSLIAAHAVAHKLPLLTQNVRDFLPVDGLHIVQAT